MDRINNKLATLRAEVDAALARAEAAEQKNKQYEQLILEKDQEITSLTHKISILDADLEKTEKQLANLKALREDGEQSKTANEVLVRKIQLLEEELDAAERNVKETVEKLRQVDVKAEHFERQLQRVEQEKDSWEKKHEEVDAKHRQLKQELDELVMSMEAV